MNYQIIHAKNEHTPKQWKQSNSLPNLRVPRKGNVIKAKKKKKVTILSPKKSSKIIQIQPFDLGEMGF